MYWLSRKKDYVFVRHVYPKILCFIILALCRVLVLYKADIIISSKRNSYSTQIVHLALNNNNSLVNNSVQTQIQIQVDTITRFASNLADIQMEQH
jgi:hypothetical protein